MIKLKNIFIWLIALQLFLPASFTFSNTNKQTYKIGVLAYKGKEDAVRKWSAHAGYLNWKIPELKFEIVPLSYNENEMTNAVKSRLVDFIITNPGHIRVSEFQKTNWKWFLTSLSRAQLQRQIRRERGWAWRFPKRL